MAEQRLKSISSHLNPPSKVLATKYRPTLIQANPNRVDFTNLNPITFLLKAASIFPSRVGLSHPETNRTWTYSEWADRVANLSYALKSCGVTKGDRVVVISPNTPLLSDALQGIPAAQGIIVALNYRQTKDEINWLIENSGAKIILIDFEFKGLIEGIKGVQVIVCSDGAIGCEYEKFLVRGREFDLKSGDLGWSGLPFTSDELDIFSISYTSGTTSRPKGVETTYRATYLAAIANAVESGLNGNSKYLAILPNFHCLGWCFPYATTMAMCLHVCMRAVGNYDQTWDLINNFGITNFCGAPTVMLSVYTHKNAKYLKKSISVCIAGAAPSATLITGLENINIKVVHVYGLTETLGPAFRNYSGITSEEKSKLSAAFLTADDVRIVRILTEEEELNPNVILKEVKCDGSEIGEIVTRGNIVMKGYYNNPIATQKAFAGGYFHTGDLAVRFENGSFMIQDRSKDIIISGGENVSSLFIESKITEHEEVLEVAIVARKDLKWGEVPYAFLVLKNPEKWIGRFSELEIQLKEFAKARMAGFATPKFYEVVNAIEKSSTGKVSKVALRALVKSRDN